MKELTKAEEQVMQYVWKLEKGFLKDIIDSYPEPRPAYTTVSTVVGVLVKKGFIGFNTYGKIREYYPLISKEEYSKESFKGLFSRFFNNSTENFASFFAKEEDISLSDLEKMKQIVEEEINNRKK